MLNLDTMDRAALWKFWTRAHTNTNAVVDELLHGRLDLDRHRIIQQLASYAAYKATALMCREEGWSHSAIPHEKACRMIYDALPDCVQWHRRPNIYVHRAEQHD